MVPHSIITLSFHRHRPAVQFISDPINLALIAAVLVSGAMLAWPMLQERAAGPSVTTLVATQLINSRHAQLVDVRTAEEFATGSVPNARNIPLGELDQRAGELRKDRPVILFCNHGRSSGRAAMKLRAGGLGEVYVLAGGVAAWREAGLPIRK
jgi:rhodanese-related sulfurtransferase